MKPRKQPELSYVELKEIWYAKLKEAGFDDIEQDEYKLKMWSNRVYIENPNPVQREAKETYYILASRFLHDYKFKNQKDKIIWEYHANGISMRNIVKILEDVKIKTNRNAVCVIVNRLATEMKKMYGVTK